MSLYWGIDMGGTKLEAVVLEDPTRPEPLIRRRIATEASLGYPHIMQRMRVLVDEVKQAAGLAHPERIGIGTPGSADPTTGVMRNCNTTCLNDQPMPADLARSLDCEVAIANDANCLALAEARWGAGRGASVVFGVILGTGVGGGVVVNGQVINGRHGIAGEWGHSVIDPSGPDCYCGKRGCLERMVRGPVLEDAYEALTGQRKKLAEVWEEGGPAAQQIEDRLVGNVAEALGTVVNLIDPDAVILGGGVGQTEALYRRLPDELAKWVFHPHCSTPILRPQLGDSAGVFGAAVLTA